MLKALSLTIAAGAAALAFSAPVLAADMPEMAPVIDTSSFNWEGAYIGGDLGFDGVAGFSLGGEIGYNFLASESFLIGVQASGAISAGVFQGWLTGKAGFAKDSFAFYGLAGIGAFGGTPVNKLGVGAEFALNDNWTIDGELAGFNVLGGLPTIPAVQVGIRYHF